MDVHVQTDMLLKDLALLADKLDPGASLDDVDEEAVRRAFGRQAVDDLEALRRIERELQRQGYLTNNGGNLELTPKAVRRIGDTALRRVFDGLENGSRTGVRYILVFRVHSSPPPLWPQPQAFPLVSMAIAVSNGSTSTGIDAIFTPLGNRTRTGLVKEFTKLPSPS